jgi:hypothetical protein
MPSGGKAYSYAAFMNHALSARVDQRPIHPKLRCSIENAELQYPKLNLPLIVHDSCQYGVSLCEHVESVPAVNEKCTAERMSLVILKQSGVATQTFVTLAENAKSSTATPTSTGRSSEPAGRHMLGSTMGRDHHPCKRLESRCYHHIVAVGSSTEGPASAGLCFGGPRVVKRI